MGACTGARVVGLGVGGTVGAGTGGLGVGDGVGGRTGDGVGCRVGASVAGFGVGDEVNEGGTGVGDCVVASAQATLPLSSLHEVGRMFTSTCNPRSQPESTVERNSIGDRLLSLSVKV